MIIKIIVNINGWAPKTLTIQTIQYILICYNKYINQKKEPDDYNAVTKQGTARITSTRVTFRSYAGTATALRGINSHNNQGGSGNQPNNNNPSRFFCVPNKRDGSSTRFKRHAKHAANNTHPTT